MAFTIRDAQPEDAGLILQLIKELAHYEKLEHEVHATAERIRQSLFEERAAECRIAESPDGQAVGFALFFHNFSTFLGVKGLYIEDIFVRPHHRRKGIGEALLRDLARIAMERECGRMEWSVLDWNESAIRFYEKMGAVPMGEWTVFRMTRDRIAGLLETH